MLTLGQKQLQVPILQGGMGVGVSLGGLAGAVAACGGSMELLLTLLETGEALS